jgi:phytoene dehydrogenase-like protein
MWHKKSYDAIVIGAGPNGLVAAITLARADWSVLLVEANERIGGAAGSAELTLPGFIHDLGSAVHPFAVASPFFRSLRLERYGLRWCYSPAVLAHPLEGGRAALLERSIRASGKTLGADAAAYRRLMAPLVRRWERIVPFVLNPLRLPRHPLDVARFGLAALMPATLLARSIFREEPARALLAGLAAHSTLPLEAPASSAAGLVLGMLGHAVGWPIPQGGAQAISDALAACLRELGGEIVIGCPIEHIDELPTRRALLLNLTPRQVLHIAGDRLPAHYRQRLAGYRYGPAVYKVDYALDGPIPWAAAGCRRAATVHLGGSLVEIARSERAPAGGVSPVEPYVLLAQPTLFDSSRAPAGKQIAWAYCHLPHGSTEDLSERIEAQIERYAPGFRARIIARSAMGPQQLEAWNRNLVGGDISGGRPDLWQLLARPVLSPTPYATPLPGLFICSSSTPPGPGVHGMSGYNAAQVVLHHSRKR